MKIPETLIVNVLDVTRPDALLTFSTNENVPTCVGVAMVLPVKFGCPQHHNVPFVRMAQVWLALLETMFQVRAEPKV